MKNKKKCLLIKLFIIYTRSKLIYCIQYSIQNIFNVFINVLSPVY